MNEKTLHNIWKNKQFKKVDFIDTEENKIEVIDFGKYNPDAGPDFLNAKIKINNITLFGNIEIHVRSSDWILHKHNDSNDYKTVILHVVYENDKVIPELKKAGISTLELKNYIEIPKTNYIKENFTFIPCEQNFRKEKIDSDFKEKLLLEKLEQKSIEIEKALQQSKNDYEAVLFQRIAYSFGLKTNADIFLEIAKHIDFSVIKKVSQNQFQLESLLLGKADLLKNETEAEAWQKEYNYLKTKFSLSEVCFNSKLLRLRPANFPTIRLSQLASLYNIHPKLFSKVLESDSVENLYSLFEEIETSEYWKTHYVFDKETKTKSRKKLSKNFIDLLIINSILPIIFSYYKNSDPQKIEFVLGLYQKIKPEENSIIDDWKKLNVPFDNALDSQAFLFLKKEYCENKKCKKCSLFL